MDFSRWDMGRTDTARFEQLKTAILSNQVLSLTYCGMSGERSQREIHPLKLIHKDKHWYLQGYCLRTQAHRLFKVGRMKAVTAVPHMVEGNPGMSPEQARQMMQQFLPTLKHWKA